MAGLQGHVLSQQIDFCVYGLLLRTCRYSEENQQTEDAEKHATGIISRHTNFCDCAKQWSRSIEYWANYTSRTPYSLINMDISY